MIAFNRFCGAFLSVVLILPSSAPAAGAPLLRPKPLSFFAEEAVVQPLVEAPLHADDAIPEAAALRRRTVIAGLVTTAALPIVAHAQLAEAPQDDLLTDFPDEEKTVLEVEVATILKHYAPELSPHEAAFLSLVEPLSSDLRDHFLTLGVVASIAFTLTASYKLVRGLYRIIGDRSKDRPMTRRRMIRLTLTGVSTLYFAYVAYELIPAEFDDRNRSGSIDHGTIRLAHHRRSLRELQSDSAHEFFHLMGRLGLMKRDSLYADTYSLLRTYERYGDAGLAALYPKSKHNDDRRAAIELGDQLFDRFPDPQERETQLVAEVSKRFHLAHFDYDIETDINNGWTYFYGSAQGRIAIRLAQKYGYDTAYGYVGALGAGRSVAEAQTHPWDWMKDPQRPTIDEFSKTYRAIKIYQQDHANTPLVYTFIAIVGAIFGVVSLLATQRVRRRRWTPAQKIGFIVGGAVAGIFRLVPPAQLELAPNLAIIIFLGGLAGWITAGLLDSLVILLRDFLPRSWTNPLWIEKPHDDYTIEFDAVQNTRPVRIAARLGIFGQPGPVQAAIVDAANRANDRVIFSDSADLPSGLNEGPLVPLPSIEDGWVGLRRWTKNRRDAIVAGIAIRTAARVTFDRYAGGNVPGRHEDFIAVRQDAERTAAKRLNMPIEEVQAAIQRFLARSPKDILNVYRQLEDTARRASAYKLANVLPRLIRRNRDKSIFMFVDLSLLESVAPKQTVLPLAKDAANHANLHAPADIELARKLWQKDAPSSTQFFLRRDA